MSKFEPTFIVKMLSAKMNVCVTKHNTKHLQGFTKMKFAMPEVLDLD